MAVGAGSWVRILLEGSRLSGNSKKVVLLDSCGQRSEMYSMSSHSMRNGSVIKSADHGFHIP